jgi:trk system potassium uptake protein TrkH
VLHAILGFFALYIGIFVGGSLLVAATGMDFTSAGSAVIPCLSNIGPGLGTVGPTDSFAYVPVFGKWVLIFCMLMGRLELFTVLVLFFPSFWRK